MNHPEIRDVSKRSKAASQKPLGNICSAVFLLVVCAFGSNSASAQDTYWLGRIAGDRYVFDKQLPAEFGAQVLDADENKVTIQKNLTSFPDMKQDGASYRFGKVSILHINNKVFHRPNYEKLGGGSQSITEIKCLTGQVANPGKKDRDLLYVISSNATKPNLKISIYGAGKQYWFGRKAGNEYIFDVPMPFDTGKAIVEADRFNDMTFESSVQYPAQSSDGTKCRFYKVSATYDSAMHGRGEVGIPQLKGGNKWISFHKGEAVGRLLTAQLPVPSNGKWTSFDMLIVATSDQSAPVRIPAHVPFIESAGGSTDFNRDSEYNALATYGVQPQILGVYQNKQLTLAWQNHGDRKSVKVSSWNNGGSAFTRNWTKDVPQGIERLAGFVGDGTDLYCMTSNSERTEFDKGARRGAKRGVLNLVKFNPTGTLLWQADLSGQTKYQSAEGKGPYVYSPMVAGTGDLAYGDGKVAVMCAVNTEPDPKINYRRHQTAFRLSVNSSDGNPAAVGRQYSNSHSFDQRVVFDGKDFVCLDQPDQGTYMAGGGIELTKILSADNSHASNAKGWYAYIRNGMDNFSSINMTDFAVGKNGYVVPFIAQKNSNLKNNQDARNIGLVHVVKAFEKLPKNSDNRKHIFVDSTLVDTKTKNASASGNVPPQGGYRTSNSGSYRYTGVTWLTDYKWNSGKTAACSKIHKFDNNRYLVLFEEWGFGRDKNGNYSARNTYQTTKAMLVDEYGNLLKPAQDLGRMPLRYRDSLFKVDGKAGWAYFDPASWQFRLCLISPNLTRKCYPLNLTDQVNAPDENLVAAKNPSKAKPKAAGKPPKVAKKTPPKGKGKPPANKPDVAKKTSPKSKANPPAKKPAIAKNKPSPGTGKTGAKKPEMAGKNPALGRNAKPKVAPLGRTGIARKGPGTPSKKGVARSGLKPDWSKLARKATLNPKGKKYVSNFSRPMPTSKPANATPKGPFWLAEGSNLGKLIFSDISRSKVAARNSVYSKSKNAKLRFLKDKKYDTRQEAEAALRRRSL